METATGSANVVRSDEDAERIEVEKKEKDRLDEERRKRELLTDIRKDLDAAEHTDS